MTKLLSSVEWMVVVAVRREDLKQLEHQLLSVKGGPKTGVYIEYSSLNMEIVEIQNATGKLSAKAVGNSTVCAAFLASGGTLVCEAFGRVKVDIGGYGTKYSK